MKHKLKRIWDKTSKQWAAYCGGCEVVYSDDSVRDGMCPGIVGTTCNRCLAEMEVAGDEPNDIYGVQAEFDTGYFSTALDDGYTYRFNLCEDCLVWLFGEFEKPTERKAYMGGAKGEHRWHDDRQFGKDPH